MLPGLCMDAAPEPAVCGSALEWIDPGGYWRARFQAMASPCEVLVDADDEDLARRIAGVVQDEALRIEHKFSRYRNDNIVHAINSAAGRRVRVDDETASLIDFAAYCHQLSGGRFDITSGLLRRVWTFDGSDRIPDRVDVSRCLQLVGWSKVEWRPPWIRLPAGMEIDLGGIGKEYAVDRAVLQVQALAAVPVLVNFGGDLCATGPRRDGSAWQVGIRAPGEPASSTVGLVGLRRGGLATSGDSHRFLLKDGIRYSHILDPRTGWPVVGAPRSVTVAAVSCTEAGLLATLAMLQGRGAAEFLQAEGVPHWIA